MNPKALFMGFDGTVTVRDHIAIEVTVGLINNVPNDKNLFGKTPEQCRAHVAKTAYQMADALIAESNKKPDESSSPKS